MSHEIGFLLATGFGLGLAYAAVPGPVNTESIRRGFAGGFWPALLIQVGAMVGDIVWAILGLAGVAVLSGSDAMSVLLGAAGAGFLLVLAHGTFRSALAGVDQRAMPSARPGRHVVVGAMFSLANPIGIAFWAGVGGGLVVTLDTPSQSELAVVLASFMVAVVFWAVLLAAGITVGRRYARPGLFRLIDVGTGIVLGWFGLRLLYSTVQVAADWFQPLTTLIARM